MPILNDTPGYQLVAQDIKNIWNIITKVSTYNAKYNDYILADATDAEFTITLPAISDGKKGGRIGVKKVDSSVNVVTLDTTDAATIDDADTITLSTQNEAYTMVTNGSDWYIV